MSTSFGVQVRFAFDGSCLLGTGGALKQALPLLGEAFFVLYGDSCLPCDYGTIQTAFEQSGRLGLMTVFLNDGCWDRSNVACMDGHILAYDKHHQTPQMRYIDYGRGVFHRTVFADVPEAQGYDLAALYQEILVRGALAAYEVSQRFYEIGSFAGLEETRQYLAAQSNA